MTNFAFGSLRKSGLFFEGPSLSSTMDCIMQQFCPCCYISFTYGYNVSLKVLNTGFMFSFRNLVNMLNLTEFTPNQEECFLKYFDEVRYPP